MTDDSRARMLFDQIVGVEDPVARLRQFVTDKTDESEFLEFKGAGRIEENDKAVKLHWSRALSGFANTSGGVFIWGIDSRRDAETGIDAAIGLDLSRNPAKLCQTLKDVQLEAVEPPVAGVEIKSVIESRSTSEGYVVCLIPQSSHKPHMGNLAKDKQYYLRIGDSFKVMPHPFLRSLFYPTTSPVIELQIVASHSKLGPRMVRIKFVATMTNVGNATARDVYVTIQSHKNFLFRGTDEWISRPIRGERKGYDRKYPLHPGEISGWFLFLCDIQVGVQNTDASERDLANEAMESLGNEFPFSFLLYALNVEPQIAKIRFAADEVLDLTTKSEIFARIPE